MVRRAVFWRGREHLILSIALLLFTGPARAQIKLDPDFDSGPGFDVFAEHAVPLEDGKILVCGHFHTYDGQASPYLARLNEDGTLDSTFQTKVVNDWIRHLAVQPDGKIIVGGAFSSAGGLSRNLIARLNADGSLDETFDPGRGFEEKLVPPDPNPPYIFWLALQRDGKIVVTGSFAKFNGHPAPGIARLNADGSLDTSFRIGGGFDSWGRFVMVQPNDQILVTGWFTQYNGFACNRMVRLNADGTPDETFKPFFGDKTAIYSAALLPDGKMIVSGHSKNDEGLFKREMTRLNADGTEDASFLGHTDNRTESIVIQPDGKILICGWFEKVNDNARWRIARLNADGSFDDTFRADADFFVWNLALDAKGRILAIGGFPKILGTERLGIARLVEEGLKPQGEDPPPGGDPVPPPDPGPEPEPDLKVQIAQAAMVNGTFQVSIETGTNGVYRLEQRTDFGAGEWTTIDSLPGNGARRTLVDFKPPGKSGCYRIRFE